MKKGDILYCKKDCQEAIDFFTIGGPTKFFTFEKDKAYSVTDYDPQYERVKICELWLLTTTTFFYELFYSEKETRKLKLKQLDEKR